MCDLTTAKYSFVEYSMFYMFKPFVNTLPPPLAEQGLQGLTLNQRLKEEDGEWISDKIW